MAELKINHKLIALEGLKIILNSLSLIESE